METAVQPNKYWGWFLTYGVILIILGVIAISSAFITTMLSVFLLGTLLIIGGVFIFFDSFRYWKRWKGFFLHLLLGILYVIIGLAVIDRPIISAETITMMMGIFFLVAGVVKIVMALATKLRNWGWHLLSGIISLALGILILAHWPASGLFIIGLFIGIDLVFTGWSYIMLSIASRPPRLA